MYNYKYKFVQINCSIVFSSKSDSLISVKYYWSPVHRMYYMVYTRALV